MQLKGLGMKVARNKAVYMVSAAHVFTTKALVLKPTGENRGYYRKVITANC